MADLTEIQSTQAVKIIGSDATGLETNPVNASTFGLFVDGSQVTQPTQDLSDGPVAPGTAATKSNLIGAQYNSTLPTLTTGQQAALQADSSGRLLTVSIIANLPTTVDTNYGTVGASTIRVAAQIGNATGAADFNAGATGAQTLRAIVNQGVSASATNGWYVKPTDGTNSQSYTAAGEAKVSVTQPLPAGTNNIGKVSIQDSTGNAFTSSNPLYVSSTIPGTPVNKYNTTVAVAAAGTANHDYTITALKTFYGRKWWISASGRVKADIQTSPDGSAFTTFWTAFNTPSNLNITIDLDNLVITNTGTGSKMRIVVTNLDKQAQDVYSTISGTEV